MEKYVDLHMHSTMSDGTLTVSEIIKEAKEKGLKAISITDHDTVKAYTDLDITNQGIEIIRGVEIVTTAARCPVEVTCYGYDIDKMQEFLKKYSLSHAEESKIKADKEIAVLKSLGVYVKLDTVNYDYDKPKNWIITTLWNELMQNEKAKKLLAEEDDDMLLNSHKFFRKGMSNIKSKFFVDLSNVYVSLEKLREFADETGAVLLLAHPGEYYTNMDIVLDYAKDYVDGLETYHPSISPELRKYLKNYCKEHNLIEGGGSDYHGYRGALNSEKVPYSVYEGIVEKLSVLAR